MGTRFKLLEGRHYECKPESFDKSRRRGLVDFTLHEKGAVIDSDRPLDQIYIGKFEKAVEGINIPKSPPTDVRKRAVMQMILQGQWQETDTEFLEGLSEEDFVRIQRHTQGRPESKRAVSPLGEDVTDLFQRAYDEGFKVYRNGAGKHQVTRAGIAKPLNKDPLDAEAVDKFVAQHLKEK